MQAVLFDLYETLARPIWPLLRAGRMELAARVGIDWERMRGLWEETLPERTLGTSGSLEADIRALLALAGRTVSDAALRELAALEYATWRSGVELYPDSLPTLRELRRRGVRSAIVSNCSYEAGAVVRELGIDQVVDTVILSCEVGLAKPEPAIFRLALDRLGAAADQAVLVDDRPENVESAEQLGLRGLLIAREPGPPDWPAANGRATISDLSPLLR
jgi:putative hydrolase of the HAD superfamily